MDGYTALLALRPSWGGAHSTLESKIRSLKINKNRFTA
jgi:hypothetical protein